MKYITNRTIHHRGKVVEAGSVIEESDANHCGMLECAGAIPETVKGKENPAFEIATAKAATAKASKESKKTEQPAAKKKAAASR